MCQNPQKSLKKFFFKFFQNGVFSVNLARKSKKEVYRGHWIIFEALLRDSEIFENFIDYRPYKGNPQISVIFQRVILFNAENAILRDP